MAWCVNLKVIQGNGEGGVGLGGVWGWIGMGETNDGVMEFGSSFLNSSKTLSDFPLQGVAWGEKGLPPVETS